MPNWKKVAISGSNISQFNNDGVYTKMVGTTANGLLTHVNAETASVEPTIIYDGASQYLKNDGKHITYSGSIFSTPPASAGTLASFNSGRGDGEPWDPVTGSGNYAIIALSRYANFGSGNECSATLGIIAQRGNSVNNAVVELTSIAKQNSCNDAIFSLGVRSDAGAGELEHPVNEFVRIDGRDETIFFSGSVSIQTNKMASTGSIGGVLVYDDTTGQIKKSTVTPTTGTTSAAGAGGNVQYNDGSNGFAAEAVFTYNAGNNTLSAVNITTDKVSGDGNGLVLTDGDNDTDVEICSYGTKKATFSEIHTCIGASGNTNAFVCNLARVIIPDGSSSKPSLVFSGDQDMGFYRSGTSAILGVNPATSAAEYNFTPDGLKIEDGALAVGNISPSTTTGRIDASNDIVAYSTSDCRLKKYVKPIPNALDKIDQIRGVEFDWKVTDEKMEKEVHSFEGHDVGVIAQEIEAVLPEVVTTRDSGYKAVRYDKIVPLLIQGIKELKSEVEILKSKI